MKKRFAVQQEMTLRKLARRFLTKADAIDAKNVLITSVQKGDGKSLLGKLLIRELKKITEHSFDLFTFKDLLADFNPDHMVVKTLVDGPAYFDPDGLTAIPERWMRTFDAVLIPVAVRQTDVRELADLVDWLRQYNIQHIWPILNYAKPPTLKQRIFGFGKQEVRHSLIPDGANVAKAIKESFEEQSK